MDTTRLPEFTSSRSVSAKKSKNGAKELTAFDTLKLWNRKWMEREGCKDLENAIKRVKAKHGSSICK